MAYGAITGKDVMMKLLISDGDSTKASRESIFNPALTVVGIYSGTHKTHGHQSCVLYVDEYTPDYSDSTVKLEEAKYRTLDTEIFAEQNKVRADPTSYVDTLKAMLPRFKEKVYKIDGRLAITTSEGKVAVEEAIKYLESATGGKKLRRLDKIDPDAWKAAPIMGTKALTLVDQLTTACKDHVADTGPSGVIGHIGADKSTFEDRIARYGKVKTTSSENLAYGAITATDIIVKLIVADGDSDRATRLNIFNPELTEVGIFSGTHEKNGH